MDSHAHEDLSRKKIKKLAGRYSETEVRASLGENADFRVIHFRRSERISFGDVLECLRWLGGVAR